MVSSLLTPLSYRPRCFESPIRPRSRGRGEKPRSIDVRMLCVSVFAIHLCLVDSLQPDVRRFLLQREGHVQRDKQGNEKVF